MNSLSIFSLKALRKAYALFFSEKPAHFYEVIKDANVVSKIIHDQLTSTDPCMIARFGSTELNAVINYLGIHEKQEMKVWQYIRGKRPAWWWNKLGLEEMQNNSGFFPLTIANIERFCKMMIQDIPLVDVLASWRADERYFENELKNAYKIHLELLNPYFSDTPWTQALENKKVLVVHPFASSIESQYLKRELLFEDRRILPAFELKTIEAVQSLGGDSTYSDWFEALDYMKTKIDNSDYDICLIGCGAYGFPLAAHVKRTGKKAVHFGGSLQLLFGIRGSRWENPNNTKPYNYVPLMNEHWVRPAKNETPSFAHKIEGACYW